MTLVLIKQAYKTNIDFIYNKNHEAQHAYYMDGGNFRGIQKEDEEKPDNKDQTRDVR